MLPAGDHDEVELYNAREDGGNYRPKQAELIEIIYKIIIAVSSWLFI